MGVLEVTKQGLYCPAGDFTIDPWRPVDRAVVTHAHADHARPGSKHYLAARAGLNVMQTRLGRDTSIQPMEYGEKIRIKDAVVSLHPAGHVLGSAQVRVEVAGEVWVASGDYKTATDPTCARIEPIPCDTFITESTFGLPVYRWPDANEQWNKLNQWWADNQQKNRTTVVFAYSLGKAQRLLAALDPNQGPIAAHDAVLRLVEAYRADGVELPTVHPADEEFARNYKGQGIIVTPPSGATDTWLRKFSPYETASASGWMQIRGTRRRRTLDRGFVVSDHADWDGLIQTIHDTGAPNILVTHGYTAPLVRWLQEKGLNASTLKTSYTGERPDGDITSND